MLKKGWWSVSVLAGVEGGMAGWWGLLHLCPLLSDRTKEGDSRWKGGGRQAGKGGSMATLLS